MYTNFFKLLIFYTKKKLDIKRTLTGFQLCVIIWTVGIVFFKISQILIILSWASYFQLAPLPREPSDILVNIVFQKIYIPICDFLVTLSFLYFFYQQNARIKILQKGNETISRSFSKFFSLRDVQSGSKKRSSIHVMDYKINNSTLNGEVKESVNLQQEISFLETESEMVSQELMQDESSIYNLDKISMFRCFLVDQFVPKHHSLSSL